MSFDVYSACPCGSGKKLKFCCNKIAAEMEKVARLHEAGQNKTALQQLDEVETDFPGNMWATTSRAAILLDMGEPAQAQVALEKLLAEHPDHLFAIALNATACFTAHGYDEARRVIHKAFQRCTTVFPDVVSGLAIGIAAVMHARLKFMAARQHLTFAMRIAPESDQQEIFVRLLEFDSNGEIPYPMRSVHELARLTGDDELESESAKAKRFSDFGCWDSAARIFEVLTDKHPDNAALWENTALCHAWDGNEDAAAKAYHRAAELHSDPDTAVECETLAQLLDESNSEEGTEWTKQRFVADSVALLLGKFDEAPRFVRMEVPPTEESAPIAAIYELVGSDLPEEISEFDVDQAPAVIGQLTVYPAAEERPAELILVSERGDHAETARALVLETAESLLEPTETEEGEQETVVMRIPSQYAPVARRYFLPPELPFDERRSFEHRQWDRFLDEEWSQTPLASLDGKSPRELAGDASAEVKLAAAVMVLDSYCDAHRRVLDCVALREKLELPEPQPLPVDDQTSLGALSSIQFLRLPVRELSDTQLSYALNRALLVHHERLLYDVMREVLERPACKEQVDLARVYETLTELAESRRNRDEALQWIACGVELARASEDPFRAELQWKMRELAIRIQDHTDPALRELLLELWQRYGSKLPQLRTYLTEMTQVFRIDAPWEHAGGIVVPGEAETGTGVWSPDAPEDTAGGDQKLWLPGQG